MTLPVAVKLPKFNIAKPFWIRFSSVLDRDNVPVAPAKPTVVVAVRGWIVNVPVPATVAASDTLSVVSVNAFAPIANAPPELVTAPGALVTTSAAVTEVVPRTYTLPTAALKVTVPRPVDPVLIVSVRADVPS